MQPGALEKEGNRSGDPIFCAWVAIWRFCHFDGREWDHGHQVLVIRAGQFAHILCCAIHGVQVCVIEFNPFYTKLSTNKQIEKPVNQETGAGAISHFFPCIFIASSRKVLHSAIVWRAVASSSNFVNSRSTGWAALASVPASAGSQKIAKYPNRSSQGRWYEHIYMYVCMHACIKECPNKSTITLIPALAIEVSPGSFLRAACHSDFLFLAAGVSAPSFT